jgi:RNA 2',3'-cyclic 3'-phosphodiesterase
VSNLRLFIAIDPSPEVRGALAAEMDRLRRRARNAKWVDVSALHVTLAFLGEVDEARVPEIAAALTEVTRRHAPFDAYFRSAGAFRGKRPRVLWVGVLGDLVPLHYAVVAALEPLGFPREQRQFSAHLTLARARDPDGDDGLVSCAAALSGREWGQTRIAQVTLYRSDLSPQGPTYTALATCPLGDSGGGSAP